MKKQVFGALVAGLLMVVPAASQDVPPGPLIPPIDVEKIQVKQSKKADEGWVLTISCSKSREIKLPEGTLLDCELRVGVTPVYYFKHQLGSKSRFKIVEKTGLTGFVQNVTLRIKLDYVKQSVPIREYIDKKPQLLPKNRMPWTYKYGANRFDLGDVAKLETQKVEVRKFFKEKIEALVAADRKLSEARKRAIAEEGFQKGGKFDPNGWQAWIEKEVRDPIREIQAEIRDAPKLKFYAAKRDLDTYLVDLSRAVARRSYARSRDLYEELGLAPDPADSVPKKIDANSKKYRAKDLKLVIERLRESQQIRDLSI